MGRLRIWLFHLLSRIAVSPPDDPLPRPTPGEIMAVRVLIPTESNRTPGEQICIAMFRLGYRKRASEEQPTFKPVAPAPQPGGTTAVFVDKTAQAQVQREMTQETWLDKQQIDLTGPLKIPYYLEQIHTQHSLPAMPAVSPLRKSRLAQILHAAVPVPPPIVHKTRQLTPLPEPIEFFEEDRFLLDTGEVTERREAV